MYMGMNGRILNPKIWSVFVLLHPVSFLGQLIKRYLTRLTSLFRAVHSVSCDYFEFLLTFPDSFSIRICSCK